jgi:RNA polymerase sigma factor (sigma-70 family)
MSSPMTDSSRTESDDQVGTPLRRAMSGPLLSAVEERRLAIRIEQGDQAARQRMIESNLRLVFSLARTYRGRGVPMADLVQEGTIGLARAVDRFDHRHEVRFSTYAAYWIHRSLRDAVAAGQLIRIPPRAHRQLAAVRRAEDDLRHSNPGSTSIAAVAERTGLSVESVRSLRGSARATASLDEPVGEDGTPLGELVADDRTADPSDYAVAGEESRMVSNMVKLLPERHRNVVVRRYGLGGQTPQSHEQIGAWLGVGEERSRQLEHEALHRLRTISTAQAA